MKPVPQTALDERVVEDAELEKALEDREIAKGGAGEARKKFETVDEVAKGKIGELKLGKAEAVRIGRFRVAQTEVAARSVSFETKASSRLKITTPDEEE